MTILYWVLLGALAGWITGKLLKGEGFGTVGNIIVGIAGALVGGWLQKLTGIQLGGGMIGGLVSAVLGAVVLMFVVGMVKKN